jgi:hypothetical protein
MASIHRQTTNPEVGLVGPKKGGGISPFFKRRLLSPFSSTSSVFSTNSSTEEGRGESANANGANTNSTASAVMQFGGAQVRRISVPLSKAKNSFAARRLSHFVQSVGDAVQQEIMIFNGEQ